MSVHAIPRTTVLRDWPSANRPRDQKESARPSTKFQALTRRNLDSISQYGNVTGDDLFAMKVVSAVLPFRTNRYVIEHLIDWDRVPDDPVYKPGVPATGHAGRRRLPPDRRPHGAATPRRRRSSALPPKSAPISIRIRPGSGSSISPVKKARLSKDSSTNIAKQFCSSRARARPATPTAHSASAGRNSLARRSLRSQPRMRSACTVTSPTIPESRTFCSRAATR